MRHYCCGYCGQLERHKMNVLLDLEFTGLDNTFVADHEITQIKMLCVETGKRVCRHCKTDKPVSVYDRLQGVTRYNGKTPFSADLFHACLNKIKAVAPVYHGYSIAQDRKMLSKYGINIEINDLQEAMRLNPEYETRLAIGTASMEAAYYLLTGEVPNLGNHYAEEEIELIRTVYEKVQEFDPAQQNKFLTVMPWGHCAGMPLDDYIANYRRAADGYRFNNNDLLARSLTHYIPEPEYYGGWDGDEDESDDLEDGDDECDE